MLRIRAVFPIAIAMILASCAASPAADPPESEALHDDAEATLDTASTAQAATATTASATTAAVSCSVVTTCNAAGSDGTHCRQQGCSLGAAELECELEAISVCGTAVCPVILIRTDGTRENLCGSGRP